MIYLDGTHAHHPTALLLALGEAANGPGGYYGISLVAVEDCCHGGFGPKQPFTVIWTNVERSEVSRRYPRFTAELIRALNFHGVEVQTEK